MLHLVKVLGWLLVCCWHMPLQFYHQQSKAVRRNGKAGWLSFGQKPKPPTHKIKVQSLLLPFLHPFHFQFLVFLVTILHHFLRKFIAKLEHMILYSFICKSNKSTTAYFRKKGSFNKWNIQILCIYRIGNYF